MIKSTKNVNVAPATAATTANSFRLMRIVIDFRRKIADAKIAMGQDDGTTFTPTSTARLSFDIPDAKAQTIRTALEAAMKKILSESVGFVDGNTSVVDR